jgi:uncharacterized protein (DUF1810 family)
LNGDPLSLQRFVAAQAPVYAQVCAELRAGRKATHWMWFVFPQIRGLGTSATSRLYAIGSREEAHAYLAHPLLGVRLRECTALTLGVESRTAHEIFGSPDDLKFHSSMTLFAAVAAGEMIFDAALRKYFAGRDARTLEYLRASLDRFPRVTSGE